MVRYLLANSNLWSNRKDIFLPLKCATISAWMPEILIRLQMKQLFICRKSQTGTSGQEIHFMFILDIFQLTTLNCVEGDEL